MTWRATVLTIFPELFPGPLGASLAGKALASGLWSCEAIDIRDFGEGKPGAGAIVRCRIPSRCSFSASG
jgi:tRNA G37 N-methylase TrmD